METRKSLTGEMLAKLKSPLPKEAIKPHPTKNYLSTIKAIYVVERLNEVFGLGGWLISNEVVETNDKHVVVKSCFHAPDFGIVVSDIFGGNDNPDRGDAYKGACTDALTKIGSYLYIGMDVYKGLGDKQPAKQAEPQKASEPMKPNAEVELPWLSDKQYEQALKRVNGGEIGLVDELGKSFRMKRAFRESLLDAEKLAHSLNGTSHV